MASTAPYHTAHVVWRRNNGAGRACSQERRSSTVIACPFERRSRPTLKRLVQQLYDGRQYFKSLPGTSLVSCELPHRHHVRGITLPKVTPLSSLLWNIMCAMGQLEGGRTCQRDSMMRIRLIMPYFTATCSSGATEKTYVTGLSPSSHVKRNPFKYVLH